MKTKHTLIILVGIVVIFIVLSFVSDSNKERIDIAGSTSVQPLVEDLAAAYSENHSNLQINVQGGGSGMGIRSVSQGIADIGMSSKKLSDDEKGDMNVIELGKEGIVIGVHNKNNISDLSTEQIKKIFCGEITNWKEVGGSDEEIHVVTREDGSGTRSAFESMVMDDKKIRDDAIVQSSTESVKQAVSTDPGAIGYMSLAHMSNDVKPLTINGVTASEKNIANGKYELQRPFLIITEKNTSPEVDNFINWIKSPAGTQIIKDAKIVPSI